MLIFISFSLVPQHFGEFLGQESELISWWGSFSAVSWLLFRESFSALLANFLWPSLGPAIRLGFSLRKLFIPSSALSVFLVPPWLLFQQMFHPLASVQKNYQRPYFPLLALWGKISSPDSLFRTKALKWVTLHGHYTAERDRPCEKMMDSLSAAIQDAPIFHTSNFITSTRIHKLYLRLPYEDRPQESSRNCHISQVLNPSLSHQVAVWVLIWKTYSSFAESNKSNECFWTPQECLPLHLWTQV